MANYTVTVKTQPAGYYDVAVHVGHAFITLSALGKPDITIGYYPIVQRQKGSGLAKQHSST